MRSKFKNPEEIIEFLEGTGYRIGIMGPDFVSCAVFDKRCNTGWRVEHVIELKRMSAMKLLEIFKKYKISDTAKLTHFHRRKTNA